MTRLQQINQFERINRKFEIAFMPKVQRAIHSKVKTVINQLNTGGLNKAFNYLTTDLSNEKLVNVIKEIYVKVGRRWAQITYSDLLPESRGAKTEIQNIETKNFGFNEVWTKFILNYLAQFLTEKITFDMAATTRDAMLRVLSKGTTEGWSIDQIVNRLEDWPFERYQAARIVRTEINRAANVGGMAQSKTSQFEQQKEWMSAEDKRVRGNPVTGGKDHADHWSLDGTKIDSDDVFQDTRNGDQLAFPGDPKASAASTINCRCKAAHTFKRDSQGNLIRKRKTTAVIFPGQFRPPNVIPLKSDFMEDELITKIVNRIDNVEENTKKWILFLAQSVKDLDIPGVDMQPVNEKLYHLNDKMADVVNDIDTAKNSTRKEMQGILKAISVKADNDKIDKLIKDFSEKDYTPVIKTDSAEVMQAVNIMKQDVINILTELRAELAKKKKWKHTVSYNNDLITQIISEAI